MNGRFPSWVTLDVIDRRLNLSDRSSCPTPKGKGLQLVSFNEFYDYFQSCSCGQGDYDTGDDCRPCPSGKFSFSQAYLYVNVSHPASDLVCQNCPRGTYSDTLGSSSCKQAPAGRYVNADGQSRTYTCPIGGECGSQGVVVSEYGFWIHSNAMGEASVFRCSKGRCLEGSYCATGRKGSVEGRYATEAEQRQAYASNTLCSECLKGYTDVTGPCLPCFSPDRGIIVALWVTSLIGSILIFFLSRDASNSSLKIFSLYFTLVSNMVPEHGPIFIFVSFFNFQLPKAFVFIGCVAPGTSLDAEALNLCMPGILCANLGLIYCAMRLYNFFKPGTFLAWSVDRIRFQRAAVLILILTYSSVLESCIALLQCTAVLGDSVLFLHPIMGKDFVVVCVPCTISL